MPQLRPKTRRTKPPTPVEALELAAQVMGTRTALALALGYRGYRNISPYFRRGWPFPAEMCPKVERITRDAGQPVLCEWLRPDVEWHVVRENP